MNHARDLLETRTNAAMSTGTGKVRLAICDSTVKAMKIARDRAKRGAP